MPRPSSTTAGASCAQRLQATLHVLAVRRPETQPDVTRAHQTASSVPRACRGHSGGFWDVIANCLLEECLSQGSATAHRRASSSTGRVCWAAHVCTGARTHPADGRTLHGRWVLPGPGAPVVLAAHCARGGPSTQARLVVNRPSATTGPFTQQPSIHTGPRRQPRPSFG